jgi:hypothetical protein
MDTTWAETHPIKPAKEGKDPVERLQERSPRRRGKAAPPAPIEAPAPVPDEPATPAGIVRMADEVTAEADALASLDATGWVWEEPASRSELVAWFHGLYELLSLT